MAKIVILDVYKKTPYRISKDTCGGYGTLNDFGAGIIPQFLSRIAKLGLFWPPLSALNLTSEFLKAGMNVNYSFDIHDIDDSIDFVFLSTSIVCCDTELNACITLRGKYPRIKIFAFGSFLPIYKERYRELGVCTIIGEPEFLPQSRTINAANLKLLHSEGEVYVHQGNPDNLAPPLWSKLNNLVTKNYLLKSVGGYVPIIASRGCPYSCYEYCTYPVQQGRNVRHTSYEKIISDINFIKKNIKSPHFVFRDPVFSINKKYTYGLLDSLCKNNQETTYTIETHLNNIDTDMALRFKAANITWVKFGIESADISVRENVNRFSLSNDSQIERVKLLNDLGIKTVAMYILCQPDDDLDTCMDTIDYSIKLNTNLAQFSIFTPYPGTPFYKKLNGKQLLDKNFESYTQYGLVYKHNYFNVNSAREILGYAYKKYYLTKIFL